MVKEHKKTTNHFFSSNPKKLNMCSKKGVFVKNSGSKTEASNGKIEASPIRSKKEFVMMLINNKILLTLKLSGRRLRDFFIE